MTSQVKIEIATGRVFKDGCMVPIARRELEVLLLLASRRSAIDSRVAADLLYGDDRDNTTNSLKVHVNRIRGRLGRNTVLSEAGSYLLGPSVEVDAISASRCIANLAGRLSELDFYQRTELEDAGLQLRATCPDHYLRFPWLVRFVETLVHTGCEVISMLGWAAIDRRDYADALRLVLPSLEHDPCDERMLEVAIHAYAGLGRPGSAISHFRYYVRVLNAELGVEPSLALSNAFKIALSRTGSAGDLA